jgi:hypothetical protein
VLSAGLAPSMPLDQWTFTWTWSGHGPFEGKMGRQHKGRMSLNRWPRLVSALDGMALEPKTGRTVWWRTFAVNPISTAF